VVELPPEAVARVPSAIAALVPAGSDRFLAALELGYLTASADGLDAEERAALSAVLERATNSTIDRETFDAHFFDLDASVATLGRNHRLARTAADFDTDESRADAIRFAALVAMAEGVLHEDELAVLTEAGAHFEWPADRVRKLVDDAAAGIRGVK
jgi:tellurite resistance protein